MPAPGGDYYEAWIETPMSVDYTLRAAERCIEGEGLGEDDVPDLLGVSLSTVDYCGHAFGPDSWEMQELIVQTDALLAGFLDRLSKRFRTGEVTVVLTADHGSGPLPEYMTQLGYAAGRIKKATVKTAITAALTSRYGAGASFSSSLRTPVSPVLNLRSAARSSACRALMAFSSASMAAASWLTRRCPLGMGGSSLLHLRSPRR